MFISSFLLTPKPFSMPASPSVVPGIRVILDLTPNYRGQDSWFLPTQMDTVATKITVSVPVPMAGGGSWHGSACRKPSPPASSAPGFACPFLSAHFSCFLDADGDCARKGACHMFIWV